MELQPHVSTSGALVLYDNAEDAEKRKVEAEELDKRLRFIVDELPDRSFNVMGSAAGAGSSEFHIYRAARRREQERQARLETEAKEKALREDHQTFREVKRAADEEQTAKRRAKRQKKKAKALEKKGHYVRGDTTHDSDEPETARLDQPELD